MGSQIRIWRSLPTSLDRSPCCFHFFDKELLILLKLTLPYSFFAPLYFCQHTDHPQRWKELLHWQDIAIFSKQLGLNFFLAFVFRGFYSQSWLACCSQYWTCDRNRWTFENKLFRDMVLDKKVCHSCKSVDFWIGEIGGAPMLQRLKHHLVQSCAKLQHTDSFTRLSLMLHNPRTLQLSYSPPRKLLIIVDSIFSYCWIAWYTSPSHLRFSCTSN